MRPIAERLSPTVRNLVVAECALFGLYVMASALRAPIAEHLALSPLIVRGELWQLLTSLFVHVDFWSFAFDLIGLWFVGATIEQALGRGRLLVLFFGCGLASNAVLAAAIVLFHAQLIPAGCGDSVLALFVGLGVIYGRTQVRVFGRLVLQARVLSGILVGMTLVSFLLEGAWASMAGTLAAITLGYLLSGGKLSQAFALSTLVHRARRSSLQVLDGGRGKGGKGKKYVN